jgi:uncharacterized protein (TIGR03083 family)
VSEGLSAESKRWAELGELATNAMSETWGSLADVCEGLDEHQWRLPTECPGWSVQDQLSHLIGIERTLLGESAPQWDEPLGDHVHNPVARLNEQWIAPRRAESGEAIRIEFVTVTARRLAVLSGLTDGEWAHVGPSVIGEVAYAEFMKTRVFDSWVHEQDVRRALGRPGGSGGLASSIGLGQVQAAMGYVVGKKAAAPEGTVVRFSVTGPGQDARQFTIGVEGGRARPVADSVVPTVYVTLSGIDFLRLGCGRTTAGQVEAVGGIAFSGDVGLGRQILGAMNFMF